MAVDASSTDGRQLDRAVRRRAGASRFDRGRVRRVTGERDPAEYDTIERCEARGLSPSL
jgi:hypothetical protein